MWFDLTSLGKSMARKSNCRILLWLYYTYRGKATRGRNNTDYRDPYTCQHEQWNRFQKRFKGTLFIIGGYSKDFHKNKGRRRESGLKYKENIDSLGTPLLSCYCRHNQPTNLQSRCCHKNENFVLDIPDSFVVELRLSLWFFFVHVNAIFCVNIDVPEKGEKINNKDRYPTRS